MGKDLHWANYSAILDYNKYYRFLLSKMNGTAQMGQIDVNSKWCGKMERQDTIEENKDGNEISKNHKGTSEIM